MTGVSRFVKVLRRTVDGKHLIRFQFENAAFLLSRRSVYGPLVLINFHSYLHFKRDPLIPRHLLKPPFYFIQFFYIFVLFVSGPKSL